MLRLLVCSALLAACGSKSSPTASGPVLTPGVAYALNGIAPDCVVTKRGQGLRQRTCAGAAAKIEIETGDGDQLRRIQIRLVSMALPRAKALLVPALTPLLQQAGIDAFVVEITKLDGGQRTTLTAGGAQISIAALGTSRSMPEYAVDLAW